MVSPTDASSTPSRVPTHGSGPVRIATPSPWRTFTSYSLPVFPAHRIDLASGYRLPSKLIPDTSSGKHCCVSKLFGAGQQRWRCGVWFDIDTIDTGRIETV